jgi:hypothetical protein
MFLVSLVVAFLLTPALPLALDPCPPPSQFAGRPYFEFQVSQPAVYLAADSTSVRPDPTQNGVPPHPPEFALAQFVVDSVGVPIPGTLKLLIKPTGFPTEAVGFAITEWRYRPARVNECRVAQVVQTPLRWK